MAENTMTVEGFLLMRWGDFFQSWEWERQALAPATWPATASEELFGEIMGEMIADKWQSTSDVTSTNLEPWGGSTWDESSSLATWG